MNTPKYTFKKIIGGISVSITTLLLLIGIIHFNDVLSQTQNEFSQSIQYVKTFVSEPISKENRQEKTSTTIEGNFDLESDGEIIIETKNLKIKRINHYRAIKVPDLKKNYSILPKLYLQKINNNKAEWKEVQPQKIDREKGIIYFLLKIEQEHQIKNIDSYTGKYLVKLIK